MDRGCSVGCGRSLFRIAERGGFVAFLSFYQFFYDVSSTGKSNTLKEHDRWRNNRTNCLGKVCYVFFTRILRRCNWIDSVDKTNNENIFYNFKSYAKHVACRSQVPTNARDFFVAICFPVFRITWPSVRLTETSRPVLVCGIKSSFQQTSQILQSKHRF